jgi:hypothetical protein
MTFTTAQCLQTLHAAANRKAAISHHAGMSPSAHYFSRIPLTLIRSAAAETSRRNSSQATRPDDSESLKGKKKKKKQRQRKGKKKRRSELEKDGTVAGREKEANEITTPEKKKRRRRRRKKKTSKLNQDGAATGREKKAKEKKRKSGEVQVAEDVNEHESPKKRPKVATSTQEPEDDKSAGEKKMYGPFPIPTDWCFFAYFFIFLYFYFCFRYLIF